MKKLVDSKQYREVLDVFDEKSQVSIDQEINLALKVCTLSKQCERGAKIVKQLSQQSIYNPYIQVSLLQLYRKSVIFPADDNLTQ